LAKIGSSSCTLPELKHYIGQWEAATSGDGVAFPATASEAAAHRQSFGRLADEVDAAWRALSLPVLEPLTPERLLRLTNIVMGCLLASVSVATTQSLVSLHSGSTSSSLTSSASADDVVRNALCLL
jgi:E3 ubiquitin-protein ligase UBR4